MAPAIGDLLEAGRARARDAFAERMPRGFGPRDGGPAADAERPLADRPWESLPPEVARALHVHPQTVRYRLARLRELFGERLDAPDGRFELELALRARQLAAAG
ncbi:MAG TPA: helix-turn-helix domain-containing protein [Thermoleophilaceae bacterium]|nr:helix-turn-helix domain-containing protein [Thermoleophilaceae bacterium]